MSAELSATERRLLGGEKGHFFDACAVQFQFLVGDHGYERSFEDLGRCCYRVSFKRAESRGVRLIRIYHEDEDLVWCDLETSAEARKKMRLSQVATALGVDCPSERITEGGRKAVIERVGQIAHCLRLHLPGIERQGFLSV